RGRLGERAADRAREWDPDTLAQRWEQVFDEALTARARGVRRATARHGLPSVEPPPSVPTGPDDLGWITPAQARRQVLALATSTADDVSRHWFVVPGVAGTAPAVVLPLADRAAYLRALADTPVPDYLSLCDPGDHG